MNTRLNKLIITLLIGITFIACGNSEEPQPQGKTALDYTNLGWQQFEDLDYANALTNFNLALDLDETFHQAFTGKAWSYMMMDNFDDALATIDLIATADQTADDAAVTAFIQNALGAYDQSLAATEKIINEANWQFAHIDGLGLGSIYLLRADNFISTGNFVSALAAYQLLDPEFEANISTQAGRNLLMANIEMRNPGITHVQILAKH